MEHAHVKNRLCGESDVHVVHFTNSISLRNYVVSFTLYKKEWVLRTFHDYDTAIIIDIIGNCAEVYNNTAIELIKSVGTYSLIGLIT